MPTYDLCIQFLKYIILPCDLKRKPFCRESRCSLYDLLVEGVTGYPYGCFRHFSAQIPRPTVSSILFFGPSLKKNVKQLDRNEDFTCKSEVSGDFTNGSWTEKGLVLLGNQRQLSDSFICPVWYWS